MAKQVIRLTEGDLHNIIKESVKRILKEEQFGDWRDAYDAYMDYLPSGNDPERHSKGEDLRKAYMSQMDDAFGANKEARQKALNRHINYREMLRRERLQKTPSGRDILNNLDAKYDINTEDEAENNAAMTTDDFNERLRKAMEQGALK